MVNNSRVNANILNISLTSTPKEKLLRDIQLTLSKFSKNEAKKALFVVTPNPEQVILASNDEKFRKILNDADIKLPDGVGLLAANKYLSINLGKKGFLMYIKSIYYWFLYFYIYTFNKKSLETDMKLIKGRKMFEDLIRLANKKGWRVFLLGNKDDNAQVTKKELEKSYKNVRILAESGPILNYEGFPLGQSDIWKEESIIKKINNFLPQMLFVGFGAPKQEKWMYRQLPKLKIGMGMPVGGTFDYISGKQKMPPGIIEDLGLEWFWRMIAGTQNIKRIYNALIVFPRMVLMYKWNN